MFWIALCPSREQDRAAWGWRASQFTPRVAWVEEALLLEVQASLRLFGGRRRLLQRLVREGEPPGEVAWAAGPTALMALAKLRLQRAGQAAPRDVPAQLPLALLTAAAPHVPTLARAGLRTWGDVRTLPRGAVSRRFGAALLEALDAAWGDRPERYPWLAVPAVFDTRLELPMLATSAPELLEAAHCLLQQLQAWLQARHHGVLAFALEWTLDLKRLDGRPLPPHEELVVRTAQPAQDMAHLRRLVGEQLARVQIAAPANHLRLRSLETQPWSPGTAGFLPEDTVDGERLHQLVERLSARLGAGEVVVPVPQADWRPEHMQRWVPAVEEADGASAAALPSALYPTWLLPQPVPLVMRGERPWYEGPLRIVSRKQRVETAWWEEEGAVVRDYCIARSDKAGLLWVYCEHAGGASRWFLQGLYA